MAHKNNKVTQAKIAEEQAIPNLVKLLVRPPSQQIQVEVAYALGCVVLSNHDNQEKLREESGFKFRILLDLLHWQNEVALVRNWMVWSTVTMVTIENSNYGNH